jgi:hypothetical protein
MKPGDLVTLSAYGKKLLFLTKWHNKVGLMLDLGPSSYSGYWTVLWQGETQPYKHVRKDLKKA